MPSYAYPPPPDSVPPTPLDEIDQILERLSKNKDRWVTTTFDQRLHWLEQIRTNIKLMGEGLVRDAMKAKGLSSDHPSYGEDWQTSIYVSVANVTGLIDTYKSLRSSGKVPVEGLTTKVRSTGQLAVRTFPYAFLDRLTLTGYEGWVIMQQGVTADNLQDHCGKHIKNPGKGKLCHVLGAGNQASIPLQDTLYKLFVENEIAVLKMNPVNDYAGKHIRQALKPLVDEGFVEVVYGAVEQGKHLCNHPLIDTMHITGSDATHDAIVWGPREGRDERKASGDKVNDKPMTSELGNVTPIIVVPGEWSAKDMEYQAANIASMVTNNASFNCIAGKLLVISAGWSQKDQLIEAPARLLGHHPQPQGLLPRRPAAVAGLCRRAPRCRAHRHYQRRRRALDAHHRPRPRQHPRHLLHHRALLRRALSGRAARGRAPGLPEQCREVLQRGRLGHLEQLGHHPRQAAQGPRHRVGPARRGRRAAVRRRGHQPLGRAALRHPHHDLGSLPRAHRRGRGQRHRGGAQQPDVRQAREERSGPAPSTRPSSLFGTSTTAGTKTWARR